MPRTCPSFYSWRCSLILTNPHHRFNSILATNRLGVLLRIHWLRLQQPYCGARLSWYCESCAYAILEQNICVCEL